MSQPHLSPASAAVALATRNTIMGRSCLPPAPKIWSAAACSAGSRSPAMDRRLAFICCMSATTGAAMAAMLTGGMWGSWTGLAGMSRELSDEVALSTVSCTTG